MKRFFALALCALLLLSCAPLTFAADDTVYIRSAADLRTFAKACAVDSYSQGKTVVLTADIDLGGETFSPIPVFAGTFDGGGRTVKGLRLDTAASVTGLFRCLTEGALVERLFAEGEVCPAGEAQTVGGIAGECRGTIRGCGFTGTVRGSRNVGGIAGLCTASGSIENCTVAGLVSGDHAVGGVAGGCEGSVRSCVSYAAVGTEEREESDQTLDLGFAQQVLTAAGSASEDQMDVGRSAEELLDVTDIGGIAGWCSGELRGCTNEGRVGYPHVGYNVGGVAGRLSGTAFDCTNRGAVFGRKDVGGVVGQLTPAAGWTFTGGRLDELRELLSQLQGASDRLLADASAQNAAMSASLTAALRSLNETSTAAQALGDEARSWLDENIGAVNSLDARLRKTADGLMPVFDALRGCTEALPKSVQELRSAYDALWRASSNASSLPYDVQAARLDLDAALLQAQGAAADLAAAAAQLRAGLGDSTATGAAVAKLADGLGLVSQLYGRIAEDLELIYAAAGDLFTAGEDPDDELLQLLANLKRIPDDLLKAVTAVSKLTGGLSGFGGELDAASLDSSAASLSAALREIDAAAGAVRSTLRDVGLAAAELAKARPELTNAANDLSRAADAAQNAMSSLNTATQAAYQLLDAIGEQEGVAFTPAGPSGENEQSIMRSLQDTNAALTRLAGELQGTSLLSDVQSASDSLFALTEFFVELYTEPSGRTPQDYIEDVSETQRTGDGVVQGCRSAADVSADTNVGGVVGAVTIELTLAPEDDWNVSGLITGGMKYLVFAVVRECSGTGAVYAKKEAAGGVVGRMDCGAVLSCQAAGSAETDGVYAGGIAGYCHGAVRGCLARAQMAAVRYVGGIVGLGRDVSDCRSLPQSLPETEYSGAIAGFADGSVTGNLYAGCEIGAVNGMSFAGQAEPVSYEQLLAESGGSVLLSSVTVQFVTEDGVFASVEVPYGGRVERLPAVPDRDGAVWVWDDFDNTSIDLSMSVGGRYVRPAATLSDGAEIPDILAEGSFSQGQNLTTEPYTPAAQTQHAVLDARTVRVTDYEGELTIRLRQSAEGMLFLAGEDGTLRETDYVRDGSYIVFRIDNGGSFVLTEKGRPVWPYFAAGGGAAAVGAGTALLIRRGKKKRAAEP